MEVWQRCGGGVVEVWRRCGDLFLHLLIFFSHSAAVVVQLLICCFPLTSKPAVKPSPRTKAVTVMEGSLKDWQRCDSCPGSI